MNLVRVSDIYKRVLGTKKVYTKTIKRDLEAYKIEHLVVQGEDDAFVTAKETVQKIEDYLQSAAYKTQGKGSDPAWKATVEERLSALEEELTKLMVRMQKAGVK